MAGFQPLLGRRVLIVEDDLDTLELVQVVLDQAGAASCAVRSVSEGLEALVEFAPDAIVSDLAIPEEDGLSFIGRVRAWPAAPLAAVPAVALSAHAYPEDRARALAAGFESFLSKPIEPARLVAEVARLVQSGVPMDEPRSPIEMVTQGGAVHDRGELRGERGVLGQSRPGRRDRKRDPAGTARE